LRAPEPATADLSRLVREAQSEQRIPSISAAAIGNGEVVWQEALGVADVEGGREATPDTQYRVGSITKTFTAAAVMQLRDAGELDLEDPLSEHVPEAAHGSPTLRRLLTHLSGLQRELPGYVWETLRFPDRAGLVSALADAEQVLRPGARWHYSNLAFALLGEVVARRSGLEYEAYVRDRLLQPLGLERTTFEQTQPAANAYLVDAYADVVRAEQNVIKGAFAAAGSLWSTTRDLCRWGMFLVEGRDGVLARETVEEMRRFQAMADLETWKVGWGLGVALLREDDRVFVGHGGAMPGFLASLTWDRETRSCAVVLTNSGSNAPVETLGLELADHAATAFAVDPKEWRPAGAPPAELEGVLGRWWSEGEEEIVQLRGDELQVPSAKAGEPPSRLVREGPDRYRTVSGHFRGELLLVERDEAGAVVKLWWGTYPLTREPETFAQGQQAALPPPSS
jgi:CubicO group peptidase (beta-lactamase class C family)